MSLLWSLVWPRTRESWLDFLLLLMAGTVAGLGVAFALGAGSSVVVGQELTFARDGPRGLEPPQATQEGPLRWTRQVNTVHGSLTLITLVGDPDESIGLPGVPKILSPGTVQVSPAVARLLADDWSGELSAYVGEREPELLRRAALALPDELLIVLHLAAVPPSADGTFYPVKASGYPMVRNGDAIGLVIVGLCVLLLPSLALGKAGVTVHLSRRRARYALLRRLGMPPNQLRNIITADIGVPWFGGIVAALGGFSAVAQIDVPFRLVGVSYWLSDMRLSVTTVLAIGTAAAFALLIISKRIIAVISRDPFANTASLRPAREFRGGPIAVLAAPVVAFWALHSAHAPAVSQLMVAAALLLAVLGLASSARFGTKVVGRFLYQRRWTPYAGARMLRSPRSVLAGTAGASVAILSIAFVVQTNFSRSAASTGGFTALIELFNVDNNAEAQAAAVGITALRGVTNVDEVSRAFKLVNNRETLVYGAACEQLNRIAAFPDGCETGMAYVADSPHLDRLIIELPDAYGFHNRARAGAIEGAYPVAGRVSASWVEQGDVVVSSLQADADPASLPLLFVRTDGSQQGLRSVLVEARAIPGVSSIITRAAMGVDTSWESRVLEPFLRLMAVAAGTVAAVALMYSMFALFRQQGDQFAMMRAIGQTKRGLAVDLGVLFAAPLAVATALALGVGTLLALACNLALDADLRILGDSWSIVVALGLMVILIAGLVLIRAMKVEPLVRDPDAAL